MKKYKIPCVWESYGYMEIEAESIHQAIEIAELDDTPLPKESSYIQGSFCVDHDGIDYEENDIFEK
jgi:hypothetical protein